MKARLVLYFVASLLLCGSLSLIQPSQISASTQSIIPSSNTTSDCVGNCLQNAMDSYNGCMEEGGTEEVCREIGSTSGCRCLTEACGLPCSNEQRTQFKNSLNAKQNQRQQK